MSFLLKPFSILILAGYAFLAVFGLFLVAPNMHDSAHDGMTMGDCPFMTGEQSMCPMDTAQHVEAWRQFSFVPFSVVMILGVIVVALFLFSNTILYSPRFLLYYKRRRRSVLTLFQILFSQGILNPKAP